MDGAIDLNKRFCRSGSRDISAKCSSSACVNSESESPSAVRASKPWRTPRTCRYGVLIATLPPATFWDMMDMMPVTVTRLPGLARSTRRRSTDIITVRGISPVGTASGLSCSFHVCWSTYLHFSDMMLYGSSGQGGSFGWRARSHVRGSEAPAKPARTGICFTFWQLVHCAKMVVALALTFDVEMRMPGTVTTFDTWEESIWRIVIGCFVEVSVTWIASCCSSTVASSV
mmetsp:Transcript_5593/g.12231  ORF Transcript_5593/g.12231 Transcript_5593/m.12231 type:complete len:229 (-) Transcript_5593:357-1043(-)